jgi:hypothetical protein
MKFAMTLPKSANVRDVDEDDMRLYASPRLDNQSASVVQIESSRLVPLIIVLAVIAGFSIGLSILTMHEAAKAEREARVMQERWNDLKVELARRGIPVSDH